MKITAQLSDEYSLYDVMNIRFRFYAVFHSPSDNVSRSWIVFRHGIVAKLTSVVENLALFKFLSLLKL